MKQKNINYKVYCDANKLTKLIGSEIKRKTFRKKYNLSGEFSKDGGIDLFFDFSFINFSAYHGSLNKINIKSVNINNEGTKNKTTIKVLTGLTYKVNYFVTLFFVLITLGLTIYSIVFLKGEILIYLFQS